MILTNAALTGLALMWGFVNISCWLREQKSHQLAGVMLMLLLSSVFFLRTMNVGAFHLPWASDAIGMLWAFTLLAGLVYSVAYILENNLLRRPDE